ncbi:MAG TPA: SRPBCC family protein [Acidimicrobiales bacterium]|nr:SRPBCC family protein [Acidimicrobiales bacterium]
MAVTSVRVSTRIDAPAEELFPLVSRHEHAVRVIDGLEQLRPLDLDGHVVGARFEAVLHLGPRTLRTEIALAELVELQLVRWVATGGDHRSLLFEFREVEEATAVRLTVSYERPGGPALLIAPVVEETVRARARATLDRLRELAGPP